jgi:biotin transport system substrate-specific component
LGYKEKDFMQFYKTAAGESLADQTNLVRAFWIFSFAVFTAIGAQIEIPHQPVPFTVQTFFVLLAGGLLPWKKGASCMLLYLGMGMSGMPVFAGASFGIMPLLGPTGGYLLSFPLAAASVGLLIERNKNFWWILLSMGVGSLIIYCFGTLQLYIVLIHNWRISLQTGLFIFSWWDALKMTAAACIVYSYYKGHH